MAEQMFFFFFSFFLKMNNKHLLNDFSADFWIKEHQQFPQKTMIRRKVKEGATSVRSLVKKLKYFRMQCCNLSYINLQICLWYVALWNNRWSSAPVYTKWTMIYCEKTWMSCFYLLLSGEDTSTQPEGLCKITLIGWIAGYISVRRGEDSVNPGCELRGEMQTGSRGCSWLPPGFGHDPSGGLLSQDVLTTHVHVSTHIFPPRKQDEEANVTSAFLDLIIISQLAAAVMARSGCCEVAAFTTARADLKSNHNYT